jgi:hypothetical protein
MSKCLPLFGLYKKSGKYLSTEKMPELIRVIFHVIHTVHIFTVNIQSNKCPS